MGQGDVDSLFQAAFMAKGVQQVEHSGAEKKKTNLRAVLLEKKPETTYKYYSPVWWCML